MEGTTPRYCRTFVLSPPKEVTTFYFSEIQLEHLNQVFDNDKSEIE